VQTASNVGKIRKIGAENFINLFQTSIEIRSYRPLKNIQT